MRGGPEVDGNAWRAIRLRRRYRMVGALSLGSISRPDEAIANEIAPLSGGNTEATATPKDAVPSTDRKPSSTTGAYMRNNLPHQIRLLALACTLALGACAAMPDRETAPSLKPIRDYQTDRMFAGTRRAWPDDSWWTGYGD